MLINKGDLVLDSKHPGWGIGTVLVVPDNHHRLIIEFPRKHRTKQYRLYQIARLELVYAL